MGYQPKKMKRENEFEMIMRDRENALILRQHLHVFLLRKSGWKLREYVDCFVSTRFPAARIIEIKYHFSQCRPEVLAMLEAMAKDPKRFQFESSDTNRKVFVDNVHGTRFQYYDFSSNHNKRLPKLYINGREFLTKIELDCIASVIESMDMMRLNEYKLQEELRAFEEQQNVFETYQSEKLSSR